MAYIAAHGLEEQAMDAYAVDGFLIASFIGPKPVPVSAWLSYILGGEETPPFDDSAQEQAVMRELSDRYRLIKQIFEKRPVEIGPVFLPPDEHLASWASGFVHGTSHHQKEWFDGLDDTDEIKLVMAILVHTKKAESYIPEGYDMTHIRLARKGTAANLPLAVLGLYRFWQQEKEPYPGFPVAVEKYGRNEPCPCGSGKKYKRCCARNAG